MFDQKVSRETLVVVTRGIKNLDNPSVVTKPMSLYEVESRGLNSNCSGTVRVSYRDLEDNNIYFSPREQNWYRQHRGF